ncbi:MAG: tRNA (N(6)-L-threonylcarbamoyladenosine(37)-C(2))-methylthiotransferase MtaB, partial [Chloroflexota bacterium]
RPGTAAAGMPGQVAAGVKKARAGRMLALAEESALAFRERFLGRTVAVLWEQPVNGLWSGLTDNYLRVYTAATDDLTNAITPVKVEKLWRDGVRGEVVG